MLKYWNYWLLIILILVFIGFFIKIKFYPEGFEDSYPGYNATLKYSNQSNDIRDRHPIYSNLVQNLNFRYKKAYNYELEDDVYNTALSHTFQLDKGAVCLVKNDYTEEQPLNRTLPAQVENAYKEATKFIEGSMKNSVHFDLPDGTLQIINPIQMVHDRLISYQVHKKIPDNYLLYIDAIFYREAKYHGKHVGFIALVEKNKGWKVTVMEAHVKGIIFEDQIAMFPVQGNDVLNTNEDLSDANFIGPKFSGRVKSVVKAEYTGTQLKDMAAESIKKIRTTAGYL